jgi:hypothetical protein
VESGAQRRHLHSRTEASQLSRTEASQRRTQASQPLSRDASQLSNTPLSSTRTCEDRVPSTRSSARSEDGDGLRCELARCELANTRLLSSYTRTKRREIAQLLVGSVGGGEGSVSGGDGLEASVMSRGSHHRAFQNGVDGAQAPPHLLIALADQHADASLPLQHASFASEDDMCSWHGSDMSGVGTCLASMSALRSRQASDGRTDTFETFVVMRGGSCGSCRVKGEHMDDCQGEKISRSDAAWVGRAVTARGLDVFDSQSGFRGLDHMSTSPRH